MKQHERGHALRDRKTKKPRREQVLKESVQAATAEVRKLLREAKARGGHLNAGSAPGGLYRSRPYIEALGICHGLHFMGLMEHPRHPGSEFQALVREIEQETPLGLLASLAEPDEQA